MRFHDEYQRLVKQFSEPLPGAPKPYDYVVEECAELIQAIQHYKRGRCGALKQVIAEMADVYTLMDAARIHMGITDNAINIRQRQLIERYLGQPNDGRHIEQSDQSDYGEEGTTYED